MEELIQSLNKIISKADEITKEAELKAKGFQRPKLISRISVFPSREEAKIMQFHTKAQMDQMSPDKKKEIEENKIKQQEIIDSMWLEKKLNEISEDV